MAIRAVDGYGNNKGVPAPGVPNLQYPNGLTSSVSDYVKFIFYKYEPPFGASNQFSTSINDPTKSLGAYNASAGNSLKPANPALPSIDLYMPEDVSAQYGGRWTTRNFSNMAQGLMSSAGALLSQGGEGTQPAINSFLSGLKSQGEAFMKGSVAAQGVAEAMNRMNLAPGLSFDDVLGSTRGTIQNPNTENLYQGPDIRNFTLTFKMVPRSEEENNAIGQIIKTFKYSALPKYDEGNDPIKAYVGIPNIVDVSFMTGNQKNKYVSQFKPAALTNVDVNYTPDGVWAAHRYGAPVSYSLRLQFTELKMLFAEELGGGQMNSDWTY